ncbi:MAG: glycosyltransferase family 4 protein [Melioribacter sp.]|nr:glycosyltransferase family 4 protein [Melioribacter sp.]
MSSYKHPTGIGQHALNLYKHLSKLTFCSITNYSYMRLIPKGFRKFSIDLYINLVHPFRNYDVVHYQNNFVPCTKGKSKKVVTIHDLGVFLYPDTVPSIYISYNRHSIINAIKKADAIITPSESVKNEILNMFEFSVENKIFVCYDGIRDIFFCSKDNPDILKKYNLTAYNYYFFLGSLSKRKNISFLLKAFIKARKERLISNQSYLVLGGYFWWGAGEFKDLININNGIISLGYLSDEDIPYLYKYCRAFIFPSIYEGFGMPIVEAMSQNVPIIVSNIPTSVELDNRHNNQMFVFELNNVDDFINKLSFVDSNFEQIRKKINYGDLSIYNYENVAKYHLELYKKII